MTTLKSILGLAVSLLFAFAHAESAVNSPWGAWIADAETTGNARAMKLMPADIAAIVNASACQNDTDCSTGIKCKDSFCHKKLRVVMVEDPPFIKVAKLQEWQFLRSPTRPCSASPR